MVKIMTHIEARSFETSKLKSLLKKATEISNPSKLHLSAKSLYEQVKRSTTKFPANFIVTMNLTF